MSHNAQSPLLLLLSLVALLLGLWLWVWFSNNFERTTETVERGWSAAARTNPYLAAEQFLRALGIDAHAIPWHLSLRDRPPPTDTLIVRGLGPMSAQQRERLQHWVAQGGHLIVALQVPTESSSAAARDIFLSHYGAELLQLDRTDTNAETSAEVVARFDHGGSRPVEVAFLDDFYLEDRGKTAARSLEAQGLPRMLEYRTGDGRLTLLSPSGLMTNGEIARHDHALFLFLLTRASERGPGRVWLVHETTVPGLPTLLWTHAPEAVSAAALGLLLWLWSLGGSLGPLLPAPGRAQRDLMLHLQAGAELLHRHGRGGVQRAAARRRVEAAWLRRHPMLRGLSQHARARWLAKRLGLSSNAVHTALYDKRAETDLVGETSTLQRLWVARRRHGRRQAGRDDRMRRAPMN